jgi:hypothetical protein
LPEAWFPERSAQDPNYLDLHLIPKDPALWKVDRFPDFIAERKKLIRQRFAYLLSVATGSPGGG